MASMKSNTCEIRIHTFGVSEVGKKLTRFRCNKTCTLYNIYFVLRIIFISQHVPSHLCCRIFLMTLILCFPAGCRQFVVLLYQFFHDDFGKPSQLLFFRRYFFFLARLHSWLNCFNRLGNRSTWHCSCTCMCMYT